MGFGPDAPQTFEEAVLSQFPLPLDDEAVFRVARQYGWRDCFLERASAKSKPKGAPPSRDVQMMLRPLGAPIPNAVPQPRPPPPQPNAGQQQQQQVVPVVQQPQPVAPPPVNLQVSPGQQIAPVAQSPQQQIALVPQLPQQVAQSPQPVVQQVPVAQQFQMQQQFHMQQQQQHMQQQMMMAAPQQQAAAIAGHGQQIAQQQIVMTQSKSPQPQPRQLVFDPAADVLENVINDRAAGGADEDGSNVDDEQAQANVAPEPEQPEENQEPPMCVICQFPMFRGEDVTALECGHALHTACFERWQQVSGSRVFVCAQGCHRSREVMQRRREMLLQGLGDHAAEAANPPAEAVAAPAEAANPAAEAANPPAEAVAVVDPMVENFVEELSEAMGNNIL